MTSSYSSGSNRLDPLLVLRAFACLMVVVIHCDPPRNTILFRGIDLSWLFFSHGLVAVWIFFCLSGYLMGKAFFSGRYALSRQGVLNFWRNRVLRIVPLYGFTVLILSFLVYPEMLKLENWGTLFRIFTFTYQPYLSMQPLNFNGVLWSLSTEVQFYLVVPFLYVILKRHVLKPREIYFVMMATILAVFSLKFVIWLALNQQLKSSMYYTFRYWYTPLTTNIDVFLMGFLMNPLLQARYESGMHEHNGKDVNFALAKALKSRIYQIVAVALVIVLYLFTAHHLYHQELWLLDPSRSSQGFRTTTTIFILQPVTALITAYFVFAFECDAPRVPSQKLSFIALLQNPYRILEIFGNLSYGVYLWHLPILQNVIRIVTAPSAVEAFYLRLTVTLILSLILATVTYYTVELPAARWKIYRSKA